MWNIKIGTGMAEKEMEVIMDLNLYTSYCKKDKYLGCQLGHMQDTGSK